MKVKELMQTNVATLRDDETLDAAETLMQVGWIRHLPVVTATNQLVGILTHRDLLKALPSAALGATAAKQKRGIDDVLVSAVMTKEVKAIGPEAELVEAVEIILANKFGGLPVVAEKQLVGMLTETDLLQYLQQLLKKSKRSHVSAQAARKTRPRLRT